MPETTPAQPVEQQATHSPLPWRVFTERIAPTSLVLVDVVTVADVETVCELSQDAYIDLANAAFIVRAANSHHTLVEALKECSFRLATLVAASADFSEANAKALDMASAALALADDRALSNERTEGR